MVSKELIDFIKNELTNNEGWFDKENEDKFNEVAGLLLANGMYVETIKEIFEKLYWAVRNEYGD